VTPPLPHQPHRRPVAHPCPAHPRAQARRAAGDPPAPRAGERDAVLAASRLRVATAAARSATLADGRPLLPLLAAGGSLARLVGVLRAREGVRQGRRPTPGAAILDSQSVRITEKGGPRGDDGAKRPGQPDLSNDRLVDSRVLCQAPSCRPVRAIESQALLLHGCEQLPAGLLAAAACLSANPAVLVHLGVPLTLVPAALARRHACLQH
jgi:hypothetical protein